MNDLLLYRIRREHRRLSQMVDRESRLRFPNAARLNQLKRKTLLAKDRLLRLQGELPN